ncbi:MAG: three-Cys-motif partner protein TcmP [Deltaproteobacteria bacterium]|nr:three-Cys-motif partner protein TcmP [Deltaproteobacteria bacterium]
MKYISAYFNIMKATPDFNNLVYVDGFAGRGTYDGDDGEEIPGSPLRALQVFASDEELSSRVTSCFIEKDAVLYQDLQRSLDSFYEQNQGIRKPHSYNEAFSTVMNALLDGVIKDGKTLAPAFVFIDPCGVDGVDFAVADRILRSQRRAELFIFFNIEGVRRILGLGDKMGPTLGNLLGSKDRAEELLGIVRALDGAAKREEAIISYYEGLLRTQTPARFVVSFRVEKEDRRITSHYLVHASQHPLGFGIMKDVMWSVGRTAEGKGGLVLEQASISGMEAMFTPSQDAIEASVLAELKEGVKPVSYFYTTLAQLPDNRLCERAYRTALLALEAAGKLQVLDKGGVGLAPKRPMRNGALTLGKDYYVRRV